MTDIRQILSSIGQLCFGGGWTEKLEPIVDWANEISELRRLLEAA